MMTKEENVFPKWISSVIMIKEKYSGGNSNGRNK